LDDEAMTASGIRGADDLQGLVEHLADELGRSVVVNDPTVHVLCTSRHFGDEDEVRIRAVLQHDAGPAASMHVLDHGVAQWSRAGMIEGNAAIGMRPRLCVPLRERGELLGLLMVIDAERTLTAAEIARIEEVSKAAAAVLYRTRVHDDADRSQWELTLLHALGADAVTRAAAVPALLREPALAGLGAVVVTVVEVPRSAASPAEVELALRHVVESVTRQRPPRTLGVVTAERGILVQAAARLDRSRAVEQAERLTHAVARLLGRREHAVAGIGTTVAGIDEAWQSYARACAAARGARLIPASTGVLTWDDLGAYAVLLQVPDAELTPALVPAPLARLLRHEKAPRLVETLRVFLDRAGSIPRTAEELHLHRTTLYYRLEQIREITALDLDDGRARLLLHMGLLVDELAGQRALADNPPSTGRQTPLM
jgi:sugar diacid utilization regulator